MKQLRHPNRLLSSALALPVLAFALLLFATAVPAAADGGDVSRWTFAGELDERRPSVAYRLHLKGERDIQAVLGDLAADAELQIVDQRGQVVHQGEAAGLNGRSLNTRLPAGKYQVRVAGEAPTGYNLAVTSAPVSLTDDDLQGDADAEGNHGNGKDKIKSAGNGNGHGNDGAPAVVSGDFNGDGLVDDRDVELFVRALTEPETFLADHPDLTETDLFQRGDINGDGKFDAADVAAFEQLVIAQRDEEDTPADDEPVDSDLAAAQLVSDDTAMVYESSSSAPRTLQTVPFSPRGNGGGNGGGTGHTGGQGGGAPTSGGAAAPSTPGPSSPDPTDDTQPSAPEQPVEPEPVEPQQPVEPEPVEPEQPVEPEPAETEQPVDPEPAEPEQPVEPEPAEPEQPVEPEPAEPEQPVEPEPVEPEQPVEPEPAEPEQPVEPEPAETEQPVEPEPAEPEQPVEPEPVEPEQPVEPEPAETEQPVEPEPAEPEQPVEPEPAETEQPVEPEPVEPEQPVEPEPVEPEQPVEPEPVEPEQPVDPEPAETEQPVEPEPVEPEQPVDPEPSESEQVSAPALVPGSGFSGPTAQPGHIGTGYGADAKAIARWNVVPYRAFEGTLEIGVIAFHMAGIDRVEFSVDNGPWQAVHEMTRNPRTETDEYWVKLDAGTFPASGPVEVRAIVYPNKGLPRVLGGPTYDGATRKYSNHGEHSLPLYADTAPDGDALSPGVCYVSPHGDDEAGDGTLDAPFATITRAATGIAEKTSDNVIDGGVVYLLPGDHVYTHRSWRDGAMSTRHTHLTITRAPGTERDEVRVVRGEGSGLNTKLIRFKGLTLVRPAGGELFTTGGQTETYFWIDDCAMQGPSIDLHDDGDWFLNTSHASVTGTTVSHNKNGLINVQLIRDVAIHDVASNAFAGYGMVVNSTVTRIYRTADNTHDWHPDLLQVRGGASNRIAYGVKAGPDVSSRGFSPSGGLEMAVVNCHLDNQTRSGTLPPGANATGSMHVFEASRELEHIYIKGSTFVGPARWATDSTGFSLHNVVIEQSTFSGQLPYVPAPWDLEGIEYRPGLSLYD